MCADAGVVVVLTPEFPASDLSGAAVVDWPKAVIQLSVRHKLDDQFWFTYFHEAGHVLKSRRRDFLDGDDPEANAAHDRDEEEANSSARAFLIPSDLYTRFVAQRDFDASTIRSFAQALEIAPGIVVGRLQRDGFVPPSHLNDLKKRLEWPREA